MTDSTGADWEARITGKSTFDVSSDIITLDTGSGFSMPIEGNPLVDSEVYFKCSASEVSISLKQVTLIDTEENPIKSIERFESDDDRS